METTIDYNQNQLSILVLDTKKVLGILPSEIWELITKNLLLKDYHSLRMASKEIQFPSIPTTTWEIFSSYSQQYLNNFSYNLQLKISLEYLDLDRLLILFEKKQYCLVESILQSKKLLISNDFKLKLLKLSLKNGLPTFTQWFLDNTVIDECDIPISKLVAGFCKFCYQATDIDIEVVENHLKALTLVLLDERFTSLWLHSHDVIRIVMHRICILGLDSLYDLVKNTKGDLQLYLDSNWLVYAAKNGHLNLINRMLDEPSIDPTIHSNDAITEACSHGHVSIVQRLLLDSRVVNHGLIRPAHVSFRTNHFICFYILCPYMDLFAIIKLMYRAKRKYCLTAAALTVFGLLWYFLPLKIFFYVVFGILGCLVSAVLICLITLLCILIFDK
ncbi:hypothetical protein BC833DRAFT_606729 [Globomyces pollinis-pini]|nr:hypothetical protein BC833DRAFT_606729 [Globomyces pollinis-pini]